MYIGSKPADKVLTASDITDGIISSAKIADGTIVNDDVNASAAIVASKLSGAGITEYDSWRLTAALSMSASSETLITANWERQDDATFDKIGTGMSESSGIFTFPSTGKWLIKLFATVKIGGSGSARYVRLKIFGTTDNSAYNAIAAGITNIPSITSGQDDNQVYCDTLFDCTDTANRKVALYYQVADSADIDSSSSFNMMSFSFMKLGDT